MTKTLHFPRVEIFQHTEENKVDVSAEEGNGKTYLESHRTPFLGVVCHAKEPTSLNSPKAGSWPSLSVQEIYNVLSELTDGCRGWCYEAGKSSKR